MNLRDLVQYASFSAGAWRRRAQVRRELSIVATTMGMPTLAAALVPWSAVCLRHRAPTTTISYWQVAVAEVAGGVRSLTDAQRRWYRGLVVLYGTASWYERAEPMTVVTARRLVEDTTFPEWFRVLIDVCWHAVGRIADLHYLTTNDIEFDRHAMTATIYFVFLKNTIDGSLGSIKTLSLWRPAALVAYVESRAREIQIFPQSVAEVNHWLKMAGHTSRDIRRGGAIALTTGGAHESDIATALAHRSLATQRTYTQMPNLELQRRTAYMQLILSGTPSTSPPAHVPVGPSPPTTTSIVAAAPHRSRRGATSRLAAEASPTVDTWGAAEEEAIAHIERVGQALARLPTHSLTTPLSRTEAIAEPIDADIYEAAMAAALPCVDADEAFP